MEIWKLVTFNFDVKFLVQTRLVELDETNNFYLKRFSLSLLVQKLSPKTFMFKSFRKRQKV